MATAGQWRMIRESIANTIDVLDEFIQEESVGRALVREKLAQTIIMMDEVHQREDTIAGKPRTTPRGQTIGARDRQEADTQQTTTITTTSTTRPSMSPSPISSIYTEDRKICMRCFRQWDRKLQNNEDIPECRFDIGQRKRKKCGYCSERRSDCILVSIKYTIF